MPVEDALIGCVRREVALVEETAEHGRQRGQPADQQRPPGQGSQRRGWTPVEVDQAGHAAEDRQRNGEVDESRVDMDVYQTDLAMARSTLGSWPLLYQIDSVHQFRCSVAKMVGVFTFLEASYRRRRCAFSFLDGRHGISGLTKPAGFDVSCRAGYDGKHCGICRQCVQFA